MAATSAKCAIVVLSPQRQITLQPFRFPRVEMLSENLFARNSRKSPAPLVHSFFIVCAAEHSIAFELRLGEKLVSRALVRECYAPLKVFVDVARLIAVTRRLYVNNYAIRSGGIRRLLNIGCGQWRSYGLSGGHVSTRGLRCVDKWSSARIRSGFQNRPESFGLPRRGRRRNIPDLLPRRSPQCNGSVGGPFRRDQDSRNARRRKDLRICSYPSFCPSPRKTAVQPKTRAATGATFCRPHSPGFPSHQPKRTLKSVIRKRTTGEEW